MVLSPPDTREVADPLLQRLREVTAGNYDIAGELGRGGMAIVYVARDLKLDRRVAIKVMDPRLSLAQGMADRFLLEARIAARLHHPNIIIVHDIQKLGDLIFFVMSLVDGGALDELCRATPQIPIDSACWILAQASRALAHAHSEGIVHRDVKPANVMLNLKGEIVLTDFGIARAVGGDGLTKSGTQIGTPLYMSPEQFADKPAGPASDQYALGVTAYQLITGRTPFTGELYQLIAAHMSQEPRHIREVRPDCPAYLANAVMRMLAKEPEARWPSMEDLQEVFAANLPADGGVARKRLADAARDLQSARLGTIAALSAKTPVSPIPVNTGPGVSRPTPRPESLLITVSPPAATIFVGGTLQLQASVARESGERVESASTIWTSTTPEVFTISQDGVIRGVAAGTGIARVTIQGNYRVDTPVHVEPAPIARIHVEQPDVALYLGDDVAPQATAFDNTGAPRTDVTIAFESGDPSVVEVVEPGVLRAVGVGETDVVLSVGNARRYLGVRVSPRPVSVVKIEAYSTRLELGAALALRAVAFDDRGQRVEGKAVRWGSAAPGVIHVDSAGTVLAMSPGKTRIGARIDDAAAWIEIESYEPPVSAIRLSVGQKELEVGESSTLNIQVLDSSGGARSMSGVSVRSSAPDVVAINETTLAITAVSAGNATIVVSTSEVASGAPAIEVSDTIVVNPRSVAQIDVAKELTIERGVTITVPVVLRDRSGHVIDGSYEMVSSDDEIVRGGDGVLYGVEVGEAIVSITTTNANGLVLEERCVVRVGAPRAVRLTFDLPALQVTVGEEIRPTLAAFDARGEELSSPAARWSIADERVLRLTPTQSLMPVAPGRTNVSVEVDGARETRVVEVLRSPIAAARVELRAAFALVGVTDRLEVTCTDRTGAVVEDVSVSWFVRPADAAEITAKGELTPLRKGVLTVGAVIDTRSGPSEVREAVSEIEVREPTVQSIIPLQPSLSLREGESQAIAVQVNASGRRVDRPETLQSLTWQTGDVATADVSEKGVVRATAAGSTTVSVRAGSVQASVAIEVRKAKKLSAVHMLAGAALLAAVVAGSVYINTREESGATIAGANSPDSVVVPATAGAVQGGDPSSAASSGAVASSQDVNGAAATSAARGVDAQSAIQSQLQPPVQARTASPTQPTTTPGTGAAGATTNAQAAAQTSGNQPPGSQVGGRGATNRDTSLAVAPPASTGAAATGSTTTTASGSGAGGSTANEPAAAFDATDARTIAQHIADDVNQRRYSNEIFKDFFALGSRFAVQVLGTPSIQRDGDVSRIQFTLELSKLDGVGRKRTTKVNGQAQVGGTRRSPEIRGVSFSR